MGNILGMSPPDPPPDVPALPARPADATGQRARADDAAGACWTTVCAADCIQCHAMMDPIGFSLENFDGVGLVAGRWTRTRPIDAASQVFDGTKIDGAVRAAQVAAGLLGSVRRGRGGEAAADVRPRPRRRVPPTCPLVRAISRERPPRATIASRRSFSASSRASRFQMNMKVAGHTCFRSRGQLAVCICPARPGVT